MFYRHNQAPDEVIRGPDCERFAAKDVGNVDSYMKVKNAICKSHFQK
jgi:hypothetical protein